jgi:NAD(P)-dependent dehydrogenase (short-subunit alcohol dehydrogenase family)
MIENFKGKTAVLTGAGSGFGLECARIGAKLGMNLVLVDVQQDALDKAAAEMTAQGAQVLARQVDVSDAVAMAQLAADVKARFGAPHLVFNNAGVGAGGLVWENSVADWEWVLVHAHDARSSQGRSSVPRALGQHRQHGGFAHAAQYGHLQRQQTRRGVID